MSAVFPEGDRMIGVRSPLRLSGAFRALWEDLTRFHRYIQ